MGPPHLPSGTPTPSNSPFSILPRQECFPRGPGDPGRAAQEHPANGARGAHLCVPARNSSSGLRAQCRAVAIQSTFTVVCNVQGSGSCHEWDLREGANHSKVRPRQTIKVNPRSPSSSPARNHGVNPKHRYFLHPGQNISYQDRTEDTDQPHDHKRKATRADIYSVYKTINWPKIIPLVNIQ